MIFIARLAARLLVLVSVAIVSLAHADELQDINALLKQGQHAKALERVNQYLAQKPSDPNARFTKGLILAEQNKTKEAIDVFSALSRDYPELPEPYNNLAVLYASQGQYEKAREQLEKSIRTHPSYATAYENLGDVYTKLASQAYDKALQFDSSNSAAKNKLSMIRDLISTGRLPSAASPTPVATAVAVQPAAKGPPKPQDVRPADAKPAERNPTVLAKSAPNAPDNEKPANQEGARQAVLETVLAWANAWSQKKVETYLAFYAQDFKTPKGEGRSDWEAGRRERIAGAKQIEVGIESPKVVFKDDNNATVTFRQNYRSDTFRANGRKILVMGRQEGRWVIKEERSGT